MYMSYDVIIVGSGPAGMTSALYLARAGLNIALIENMTYGGQMLSTHNIENYPGFPNGIEGWKLADLMAEHIHKFDNIKTISNVIEKIEKDEQYFRILFNNGDVILSNVVIMCNGSKNKMLDIKGEKEYIGKGVSYCALCDGNFYRNKPVAVIGGGNAALEESLYLSNIVSNLYLIHRRYQFRACQCYIDKCCGCSNIDIKYSYVVKEIVGDTFVNGIILNNLETGKDERIAVDGVFIFIGKNASSIQLPNDISVDNNGFIYTDNEMNTNVKGLFAAGDIRSKQCRQIVTAVGDGATAAVSAYNYLTNLKK